MADVAFAPELLPLSGLSQTARVVDTFVAPSKTFADVLRSASWWLPFLLVLLSSYTLTVAIQQKVGWAQLVQNEIHANPKAEAKLATLPPEQVAQQSTVTQAIMKGAFYAAPLTNLLLLVVMAAVLWGTINFGFGGMATFSRVLCVAAYAGLPLAIKNLLAAALLFAGRSPDSFTMDTCLGSNPGYYLETPGALKTLLTSIDMFSIWLAVLLSIGLAVVAHRKRSAGYFAVFGWWVLILLIRTGWAAVSS